LHISRVYHAQLPHLLTSILVSGAVEERRPMPIFSDSENSFFSFLQLVIFHFCFDHSFDSQDFSHCMGIVDFVDLIAQKHTLFFSPVSQLLNLDKSLLHHIYAIL